MLIWSDLSDITLQTCKIYTIRVKRLARNALRLDLNNYFAIIKETKDRGVGTGQGGGGGGYGVSRVLMGAGPYNLQSDIHISSMNSVAYIHYIPIPRCHQGGVYKFGLVFRTPKPPTSCLV